MGIIDVFLYNGEEVPLDLHLNVLRPYVNKFIIIEADETFKGEKKELVFPKEKYADFPIEYHVLTDIMGDKELVEQAYNSPLTGNKEVQWMREFYFKESIKRYLSDLDNEDMVFIGDCDEIWDVNALKKGKLWGDYDTNILKLKLKVYNYYLNNRSDEPFWGTIAGKYKNIKNRSLNDLRANAQKSQFEYGWHFSYQGGLDKIIQKFRSSFIETAWGIPLEELLRRIENNKDLLGRNFNYWQDENEWPEYLKKNKHKYLYLCK